MAATRPSGIAAPARDAGGAQRDITETLAALAWLGETARALGLALGFSPGALAAAEAFDAVEGESSRAIVEIDGLADETLREAFARFGADLEIDLALVGLDPTLDPITATLRADESPLRALGDFRAAADEIATTQGDSISVNVRLRIGKTTALDLCQRLLTARGGKDVTRQALSACVAFYTEDALRRLLTPRAAGLWRERGLGGDERRQFVALCEGTGYLAGVALEVIGAAGPAPVGWLTLSPQTWRRFCQRAARARTLRANEIAWSGLDLPLMPDHLRVTARMPGLEAVGERLAALRVETAACALASVLDGESQPATLRFAGTRPAALRLDFAVPATVAARLPASSAPLALGASYSLENGADDEADPLVALADWAYRDASPDRLAIARDALGRELPVAAETSLDALRAAAAPALSAARANLTLYLRGAAERYFQLRGAALAAVNDYAAATRKAVTDLTSDVVDNLFKTVGLIAGVVVAGLIAPSASRPVAALACALFIAYVVFIIWYLLRARYARYELERRALMTTLETMSELTRDERRRLRAPAVQASNHFERYYRLTWWVYVALAVAGGVVFLLILTPAWQIVATSAHTSATPTPTVIPVR
jgi:TRAP-type C4-dicarboxylate transport system permease small subunit